MKNTLFSLFFLLCSLFAFGQIVNIPDATFKAKLLEADTSYQRAKDLNGNKLKIDANGNGEIEVSEAENVSELDVPYSNYTIKNQINALEGIESFKNLKILNCTNNLLTTLDVSKNLKLTELRCAFNKLTSLDLSKNLSLFVIWCPKNPIIYLNLKNGGNFEYMGFYDNPNLKYICCNEQDITTVLQQVTNNGQAAQVSSTCEFLSTKENLSNLKSNLSNLFSPNPAKDKITFSKEVKSVSVFDLSGKLVQNSIINGTEMNVSSLKTGNYILKISTENGTFTEKLVKN